MTQESLGVRIQLWIILFPFCARIGHSSTLSSWQFIRSNMRFAQWKPSKRSKRIFPNAGMNGSLTSYNDADLKFEHFKYLNINKEVIRSLSRDNNLLHSQFCIILDFLQLLLKFIQQHQMRKCIRLYLSFYAFLPDYTFFDCWQFRALVSVS